MRMRFRLPGALSVVAVMCLVWLRGTQGQTGHPTRCGSARARPALRENANCAGILIGTAVRPGQLSEAAYAATLAREYNLVEPEDALKWEVLHPQSDSFNFSDADRIAAFAKLHGMKIRGHTLLWTHQNPAWLINGKFTESELRSILRQHIRTVVAHYRGLIFAWDVVNEAVDEMGKLRTSLWYDRPGIGFAGQGTAYLEAALGWAHEADPDALLFYNDGGAEILNAKSDALYAMLLDFKKHHVPIDGIGLQMHLDLDADVASIARNIQRFSDAGLQVHITEADVGIAVDHNRHVLHSADLDRQAHIYEAVLTACLKQSRCTVFQTWGFTDKYSWINSASRGTKGAALFFDAQYHAKPAYAAIQRALTRSR